MGWGGVSVKDQHPFLREVGGCGMENSKRLCQCRFGELKA